MLNTDQALDKVSSLAKEKSTTAEALVLEQNKFSASFQQRKLDKFENSSSHCLGVRVISEKGEAIAYTENFTADAITQAFNEAYENSSIIEKAFKPTLITDTNNKEISGLYSQELEATSIDEKLRMASDLEASALDYDKRISSLPYNSFSDAKIKFTVFNTNGVHKSYQKNFCAAFAYVLAKDGDKSGMDFMHASSLNTAGLDVQKVAEKASEGALIQLNSVIPKSKKCPVVIQAKQVTTLLSLMSHHFSAKSIDEKTSQFAGKHKQSIFSDCVSIVDDPSLPANIHSRPFDAEGSTSQRTVVVNKGVLTNILSNSVYAQKLNIPNTANAARSPGTDLNIAPSHFILQEGEASFTDVIGAQDEMIVVNNLKGLAGYNTISGDFSIESTGVLYKSGEIDCGLKEFVLSGNIFDLFNQVEVVCNDTQTSMSGFSAPSILVTELSIAGK